MIVLVDWDDVRALSPIELLAHAPTLFRTKVLGSSVDYKIYLVLGLRESGGYVSRKRNTRPRDFGCRAWMGVLRCF